MINFTGIKSRPVAFLGFLSFKLYLTIETTQRKTKKALKALIGESKGARRVGAQVYISMGKARRRVRHVSMMGQESRYKAAQGTQFGRLV